MHDKMINSYGFGRIEVDGKTYTADIIILPFGILENWWRKQGHSLCLDDVKPALVAHPEVFIIGTGAEGMMRVEPEVKKALSAIGAELIIEDTPKAWKTYNAISAKKKTVVALHLTC